MTATSRLLTCLSALLLMGCMKQYVEPAGANTALLNVGNDSTEAATVAFYEDAAQCRNRATAPNISPGDQVPIKVRAGKDLACTATLTKKTARCDVTVAFTPVAGRRYLASMNINPPSCEVLVTDITTLLSPKPVKTVAKEWVQASGDAGPWCK